MPAHAYDFTGEKHGMLTAIADVGYKSGKRIWKCRCDCGNETTIPSARFGLTLSCGCLGRSTLGAMNALRLRGPRSQSTEYKSYRSMLGRCLNPKAPNFHLYGGREISVCDRWRGKDGFGNFIEDMGERPKGTSLDRIDTDGNYEPSNCQWADAVDQAKNRRKTPEYKAQMKANLDAGRVRMWNEPELRAKLIQSRKRKQT